MMNVFINGHECNVENTAALRELCDRLRGAEYRKIYRMIPHGKKNAIFLADLAKQCHVTIQMIMAFVNHEGSFANANMNYEIPNEAACQPYRVGYDYKVRRFAELDEDGKVIPESVHEVPYKSRAKIWIDD